MLGLGFKNFDSFVIDLTVQISNPHCTMDQHSSSICWETKHFTELNLDELYAILKLRSQVFIVEQGFRFLEIDGKDQ